MDRFVTRKRKPEESGEDETSGPSDSDKCPNTQKVSENVEQEKQKKEESKISQ